VGVKLDAFIKLFDSKSNDQISKQKDRVSKKESQLEEFTKLRNAAISAATEYGADGDAKIVADTFPENGVFNNILFNNHLSTLFQGAFEDEVRALFKRKNAPIQLQGAKDSVNRYIALKEAGGEYWFSKYMTAIGSTMAESMSSGVFKDSDKLFREFFPDEYDEDNQDDISMVLDYNAFPDPPRGISSSVELYEACKEHGNPLKNKVDDVKLDEVAPVEVIEEEEVKEDTVTEEKVFDLLNEDAIEKEEEKVKEEEEFGPIETPINESEDKPKKDISEIIEPSINIEESTPRKLIKYGSKGEDVEFLQKSLGIESDGKFGPITKKAVKEFQKANGLSPDGIVGPKTWSAINKLEDVETTSKIEASAPEVQPIESAILDSQIEGGVGEVSTTSQSVINEGDVITNIENNQESVDSNTNIENNQESVDAGTNQILNPSDSGLDVESNIAPISISDSGDDGTVKSISSPSQDISQTDPAVSPIDEITTEKTSLGDEVTGAINNSNIFSNISNKGGLFKTGGDISLLNPSLTENISSINNPINEGMSNITSNALSNSSSSTNNLLKSFVTGGTSGVTDSITDISTNTNTSSLEVNKEVNTLDKSFAPLVTSSQVPQSTSNVESNSESSSSNTSKSSTSSTDNSNSSLDSSTTNNNTSNEENSENKSMQSNNFNTSGLENRLRRIENLLLGPLDVKIVE